MVSDDDAAPGGPGGPWDGLLTELHAVRRRAGDPSYAELARRIAERRRAGGASEHAARIAKSTVHDAFRLGRSRINLELTREIVAALGADPALVERWTAPAPAPAPEPEPEPTRAPTPRDALVLAVACVVLNLAGRAFVDVLDLPVYLDMVGTLVAATALGPWRGAAVGSVTNLVGAVLSGWVSLPFALVNVVGALVWGYGVHRGGAGRSLPRLLALAVATGAACSAVAVPIVLALDGASPRVGGAALSRVVGESLGSPEVRLAVANLLTSEADKLISAFVALVVVSALPVAFRAGLGLLSAPEVAIGPVMGRSIR